MGSNKPKNNKDKAELKENPRSNGKGSGEIIKDARFSSANWDPKFREAPKHKSKVKIDSRFTRHLLKNQNFAPSKAPIDKRGKLKRKGSAFESLNRYYRIDGEEGSAKRRKNKKGNDSDSDTESDSEKLKTEDVGTEKRSTKIKENKIKESQREDKEFEGKKARLTLKSQPESSDTESESESEEEEVEEDSDDSSTSLTDIDDDQVYEEEEETFAQQEDNIPEIEKETHRLAVVNMDWSHVKAVDLFVVLNSFLPKGGQIKSVAVYPSEFGLKRMEEEAIHGPIGIFDNDKKKSGGDDDEDVDEDEGDDEDDDDNDNDEDGDEDEDDEEEEDDDDDDDDEEEDDDDDDEIDNEKLRAYELSRLRYYFAVVECDSVATADYLYKGCDGVEFERSSVKLDLRFIPDSMEFKHQPRDVATEAPSNYEGLDFFNRALQHSNINLTWDDDEPHRVKALKRKFNADQLAELELKEFLASDESGGDDTEDDDDGRKDPDAKKKEKQNLYRALVQSGDGSDENDEDDGENQDMEVTFNTGLEDLSKRILEKKDAQSESVWDAYLRKRKEKKKARKNRSKDSSEDESSDNTDKEAPADDEADDFFVNESSGKESKKLRGKAAKKDHEEKDPNSEATQAELELLIADDNGTDSNMKGYNLKRKKKGKRGKEIPDEGKLPTVDYEDPRFSAIFTKPLYALDPTDPQFKRSAAYARQLEQKQQKGEKEDRGSREQAEINGGQTAKPGNEEKSKELQADKSRKEKAELSSLVRSLKMKTKQMAPHVKVSEKGGSSKLKKLNAKSRK